MVLSRTRALPALFLALVVSSAGCAGPFPTGREETLPSGPAAVLQAGEEARFEDGTSSVAEVEVWRDREPVVGERPPCSDLCTRLRFATSGIEPRALQVTELWVVRSTSAGRFEVVEAEPDLPGLVVTGQRGPRAELDGAVAIVARIRRSDGTQRFVRSPEVTVEVRG